MADETPSLATGSTPKHETARVTTATVLTERVAWLIRLRWIAVLGVVCTIEIAGRLLGMPLPRAEL